jgi:hypothetical protein
VRGEGESRDKDIPKTRLRDFETATYCSNGPAQSLYQPKTDEPIMILGISHVAHVFLTFSHQTLRPRNDIVTSIAIARVGCLMD